MRCVVSYKSLRSCLVNVPELLLESISEPVQNYAVQAVVCKNDIKKTFYFGISGIPSQFSFEIDSTYAHTLKLAENQEVKIFVSNEMFLLIS